MDVLGHKTPKMALYYCKFANRRLVNENAVVKWDAEIERNAKAKVVRRRAQIRAVREGFLQSAKSENAS